MGALDGTMSGNNVNSPASGIPNPYPNPYGPGGEDAATKMMLQLAGQYGTPQQAPPVASPLHQALALLAANAGSQLLQQPGAAQPAHQAVAREAQKPETFRLEQEARYSKEKGLRLDAMIRAATNVAKQAESEGDWGKALQQHKWLEEATGKKQAWERENMGIDAANALKLEQLRQGGRERLVATRAKFNSGAMAKWPEIMKREYGAKVGEIGKMYSSKEIDGDQYQMLMQALHDDFEARDRALTGPGFADQYGNKMVTSGGSSQAPAGVAPVAPTTGGGTRKLSSGEIRASLERATSKADALRQLEAARSQIDNDSYMKTSAAINAKKWTK